jgi:hypothetical protein
MTGEKPIVDTDSSVGPQENTIMGYFTSFGVHILMVIIVILLKWQYGMIESIEMNL